MGCCSGRDKVRNVSAEAKWEYINLSDFRNKSCWTVASYVWLWFLVFIGIAVYALDTFTAVNLIAYDRWSSAVDPAVPFRISKWIFFATICFSWALLGYEWLRAIRVMRGHGVADSYMDPMAVMWQSIRPGSGQGWRRFLVFTELTKENKGIVYIALFVYFQFKGAIRILLAEGPRVVINGMTLWAVMQENLIPDGEHAPAEGRSTFQQFFVNIEALADKDQRQALILSSMLFTLVIWVFSALFLIIAAILYLLFLWHYIPSTDGSLSKYCQRKIDGRLERIVAKKVQKALKKEEAKRVKDEQRDAKKEHRPVQPMKRPTLPNLEDHIGTKSEYSTDRRNSGSTFATFPSTLERTNTSTTTGSRKPTLPDLEGRPGMPSRSVTQSSGYSVGSNAPLLNEAGPMGYSDPGHASPAPTLPNLDIIDQHRQPPPRSYSPMTRPSTAQSQASWTQNGMGMANGMRPPPSRTNTGFSQTSARSTPGPRYPGPPPVGVGVGVGNFSRRPTPQQSSRSDSAWSPHEQNYPPHSGPSIEMSPVEISPRYPDSPERRGTLNLNHAPPPSLTPGPPPSLTPGPPAALLAGTPPPASLTPGPPRSYTPYSANAASERNLNTSPAPLSLSPGPTVFGSPEGGSYMNAAPAPAPLRPGAPQGVQRSFTAPLNEMQAPSAGMRSASARPQQGWGNPRGREEGW